MKLTKIQIANRKKASDHALSIHFKPICPRIPVNQNESTLMGYRKRFSNWIRTLVIFDLTIRQADGQGA